MRDLLGFQLLDLRGHGCMSLAQLIDRCIVRSDLVLQAGLLCCGAGRPLQLFCAQGRHSALKLL